MRILRLPSYCYPERVASSHLGDSLNDAYKKEGIISVVYAPTPSRGIDKETRKKYKKIKYEEINDGYIKIHRFAMFPEPKNSLLRAFRYGLCILRQMFNGLIAKDIDIYYSGSTPPINGITMSVLRKIKKYRIVYNLQDIFPDSLVSAGMTKKGSVIWRIGRVVENITYRAADKIIVISEDFKKNIMAKGVPEEKIEVVYNWIDENEVVNIERRNNKLFDKYNLDQDKFYICYSGNIGHSQNIEMLVDAAEKLSSNPDIMFVIIGEGACKEKLNNLIAEKMLSNIKVLPFQDYSDISHVFSLGDCGLVISKKGIGEASVPSKTWSIMSAQRAVLASFDKGTDLDKIITQNNCGICVDADDSDALVSAINCMYANKKEVEEMGKNGREYILENLTKDKGTGKIINVLKSVYEKQE